MVKPLNLKSYKVRATQFTDGTAKKQSEILDMMVSPGIVRGIRNSTGIKYLVDCFKSYVEGSYKYQFGQLALSLDQSNKFVRALINEPFIEDLEKSTNPLFKQAPKAVFDLSYLPQGGNPNYSTNLLTKFSSGADMCYFFGSGIIKSNKLVPPAARVSKLFYEKANAYDVVANASGYIDNVDGVEENFDDSDRKYLEQFNYNPIIKVGSGYTVYGNMTGQKANNSQRQIHNSELLAYIKETLYSMAKPEPFKKGTYSSYLSTEVSITSFMNDLALAQAIEANPVVICNASNNTAEVAKQRIRLIHIEYTPINALDKVVFDLQIN